MVTAERVDHRGIQRDATQKLCVGFQSIEAAVHRRDDGGDHLVLGTREGKVQEENLAEQSERMVAARVG